MWLCYSLCIPQLQLAARLKICIEPEDYEKNIDCWNPNIYKKKETFSHSYPKDRRSVLEEVVFMQALSTARKSREKSRHKSSSCQRGSWRGVSRAVSCVQSAGERKHLSAAMRQMAVDSRHSLQSQRRRQRCRANIRALIYSLAVSLSRLCCIDKCVITLIHAHSFIKKLEGRLWGTC